MDSPEFVRFNRYVTSNTKPSAQAKRMSLFAHLSRREFTSAKALVKAVNGNTRDEAWVAQAIKDGEIMLVGAVLTIPSARETAQAASDSGLEQVAQVHAALSALAAHPVWTDVAYAAQDVLGARTAEVRSAVADQEEDPSLSFNQALRLVQGRPLMSREPGYGQSPPGWEEE